MITLAMPHWTLLVAWWGSVFWQVAAFIIAIHRAISPSKSSRGERLICGAMVMSEMLCYAIVLVLARRAL